jgi:hypothetical protein
LFDKDFCPSIKSHSNTKKQKQDNVLYKRKYHRTMSARVKKKKRHINSEVIQHFRERKRANSIENKSTGKSVKTM